MLVSNIQTKTEMLDNLLEIELAYSLMKSGDAAYKDPLDAHYEKLKTEIQVSARQAGGRMQPRRHLVRMQFRPVFVFRS